MEKTCKDCCILKPISAFYTHNGKPGGYPCCKPCLRIRNNKWRLENKDRSNAYQREWTEANLAKRKENRRRSKLKTKYNMTLEELELWRAKQGNRCAICKTSEPRGSGDFHVDHDHATGKVRGLLCISCNMAIGAFKESIEALQSAIDYLQRSTNAN